MIIIAYDAVITQFRWNLRQFPGGFLRLLDDLVENLGLSRNLLAARLKDLVANGIIEHEKPDVGRAHYTLTVAGLELVPILVALTAWGDKWAVSADGPPVIFNHSSCGKAFTPIIACSSCSNPVSHVDIQATIGPGGKQALGTRLIGQRLLKASRHSV